MCQRWMFCFDQGIKRGNQVKHGGWFIVHLDLVRSFSVICTNYCCRMFTVHVPRKKDNTNEHKLHNCCLAGLATKTKKQKQKRERYNNSHSTWWHRLNTCTQQPIPVCTITQHRRHWILGFLDQHCCDTENRCKIRCTLCSPCACIVHLCMCTHTHVVCVKAHTLCIKNLLLLGK